MYVFALIFIHAEEVKFPAENYVCIIILQQNRMDTESVLFLHQYLANCNGKIETKTFCSNLEHSHHGTK